MADDRVGDQNLIRVYVYRGRRETEEDFEKEEELELGRQFVYEV